MEKRCQKYPVFSMFLYFKNALINEIATSLFLAMTGRVDGIVTLSNQTGWIPHDDGFDSYLNCHLVLLCGMRVYLLIE